MFEVKHSIVWLVSRLCDANYSHKCLADQSLAINTAMLELWLTLTERLLQWSAVNKLGLASHLANGATSHMWETPVLAFLMGSCDSLVYHT